VDEKLAILTLFCALKLPIVYVLILNMKRLSSLAFVGKYNYPLLKQTLFVIANSLRNKFYTLVEVIRTYKTFSYCFIPSVCLQSFLGDRMICVMLHLVNYSYIALSLGVIVRRKIIKFAGNGATSLLGKPNNKAYSNAVTMHFAGVILSNKIKLDRDMLMGFINPRTTATVNKGVVVGVIVRFVEAAKLWRTEK
jgi:hypothetical protein